MIDIPEKLTGRQRSFQEGGVLGTFSALSYLAASNLFPKSSKITLGLLIISSYLAMNNFCSTSEQELPFKTHLLKPNSKAIPSYTGYMIGFLGILGLSLLPFFNVLKHFLNPPRVKVAVFSLSLINTIAAVSHTISNKQEILEDINYTAPPAIPSESIIPLQYHPQIIPDRKEAITNHKVLAIHGYGVSEMVEVEHLYESGRKEVEFVQQDRNNRTFTL
jgi:hypothetical protein